MVTSLFSTIFPSKPLFHLDPKIFGCVCFVRDVRPTISKLDPKALKCIFLGYSRVQKGYTCFSPTLNRYLVSSDVTFHETTSFFPMAPSSSPPDEDDHLLVYQVVHTPLPVQVPERPPIHYVYQRRTGESNVAIPDCDPLISASSSDPEPPDEEKSVLPIESEHDISPAPSDELPIALRKGKRSCTYPISSYVSYNHLSHASKSFIASLDSITIPTTLHEALSHSCWRAAMEGAMMALE